MPGSIWGQNFSYDALGNITKTVIPGSAGNSFQPTYSSSTNRITAISGFTPTYDANGNVLNDNSHIYAMDADNKAVTIDGIGVSYDALDRMVEQNRSGAHTQIVYAATGEKFALMSGQTLQKAFVPLPGGGVATYNGSGLLYYGHSDHLGSFRVGSSTTRTVSFDLAYAPFGETYALLNSPDTSFTGQRQDTSTGLYDFLAREYSNQGRWSTPDPAGLAAASIAFPQSWNRYAYVGDNPLVFTDPLGLFFGPCESPDNGLCGGACPDGGLLCSPPPPTPGQCDYVQCGNSGGGSSKGGGGKPANNKPSCVSTKSLNWSQKAQLIAAQFYSALTGLTFGFGAGLDAGGGVGPKSSSWNFGAGGSASTLIVADASGNSGFLNSVSGGFSAVKMSSSGSFWGAGAAAGPSLLLSRNPISKIAGPSGSFSAGGGAVLGAGFNITTSGAVTFSFGVGAGAEAGVSPQFGTSQFVAFCKD